MSRHKSVNSLKIVLPSKSVNEGLTRSLVGSFVAQLDPTVGELADIKTAVSEAVTNCIVHAYPGGSGDIYISCEYDDSRRVILRIKDKGVGIDDIERAREPLFTTSPETERSGMGFTIMESFCDTIKVKSKKGKGTTVVLTKQIKQYR